MCTGLEASSTFAKKSLFWNVGLVPGWRGGWSISTECQAKSLLLPFSLSVESQENCNNCYTFLVLFKQKEILLLSNKTQACEFTLLRVYLAYLFSSPLYFSCFSGQFWHGSGRAFSWDLIWALCSILHQLQHQEWLCPSKFSSAEAGSSVKATCLPAERMERGVCIMLHCLLSAEAQLRLSFHSCRVSVETTAPTGRSRET